MLPYIFTQEDKYFLLNQGELRRRGAMTGVDNSLAKMDERKAMRHLAEAIRSDRN